MKDSKGFQSDGEYLDMVAQVLHMRATRIAVETELREAADRFEMGQEESSYAQPVREVRCRLTTLKEAEGKLQGELDACLDAHRRSNLPPLGIDVVAERSRLTDDERVVLMAVTLACVGNPIAESVFGTVFSCFTGLQVSDAVQLLGAVEPSEWVGHRRMFLPDAPLFRDRHVRFDRKPGHIDGLMDATLAVGRETFATITGAEVEPQSYIDGLE